MPDAAHRTLTVGHRTDVAVARLMGSVVEDHGDHLVVSTPSNPLLRWGHYVCVLDPDATDDVDRWLAVFERAFPEADHRAFLLPREPDHEAWRSREVFTSCETALTKDPRHQPAPTPVSGYTLTSLPETQDWLDLLPQGPHAVGDRLRVRSLELAQQRRLVHQGHGAWFGASDGTRVVSSLGLLDLGDGTGRFRHVATDEPHRGRGLASWLLDEATAWAADGGLGEVVIVTDTDSDAERLYRARGFAPAELCWQAFVVL